MLLRPIMNIPSNYVRNITPPITNCFGGVKNLRLCTADKFNTDNITWKYYWLKWRVALLAFQSYVFGPRTVGIADLSLQYHNHISSTKLY